MSLGYQPLANNLLNDKNEECSYYPLELNVCEECFNCQLSVSVDSKEMFSNYLYQSSTSEKFRNHFIAEMQERKIKKNYIGVVSGIPSLGSFEINLPIGRDKKSRIKMAVRVDGRDAISIVSLRLI